MSESRKIRAVVEYEGTAYKGFQIQTHYPTIQGELEKALKAIVHDDVRVTGAARTDTGVHAKGQVIHCVVTWAHPLFLLQRAWNALLPADIALRDLEEAPEDFHARFSASSREYRYSIYIGAVRSPLLARFSYHVARPLDLAAMREAASYLVGQHDFSAFGCPPWGTNAVRTVERAAFEIKGDMVYFEIRANAFLRHMVLSIVGTLFLVGWGKLSPSEFQGILLAGDSNHPIARVSPCGLCLTRVNYPDQSETIVSSVKQRSFYEGVIAK